MFATRETEAKKTVWPDLTICTVQFDSKTIREVMTIDEIRSDLGLEPLGEEDTVEQDVKLSKVGMVDGQPVFDTIEEAEAHAKTIGCEGYHEHEQRAHHIERCNALPPHIAE